MKRLIGLMLVGLMFSGSVCDKSTDPNAPPPPTKFTLVFDGNNPAGCGNNPLGDPPDWAPNEVANVTLDGKFDGTGTVNGQWYSTVDPGKPHTIVATGTVIPVTYTWKDVTLTDGQQMNLGFNCADAHVLLNADAD